MKPDWKDAPSWANYLAMDYDGEWYWFEVKPVSGCSAWHRMSGRAIMAGERCSELWDETLEQRPTDSGGE